MNYQQTLAYLMERLPMFSRIGAAAYKPSLDNTIALCAAIGDPQKKIKTIHVAGTNGKGSVSHMLAAILQAAGYKTGLYTSPHLRDFRERIRVNGFCCEESFVVDFTERWKELMETIRPSFFEITVAMAFQYFAEQKVDIAVIETGLGGRLDSTNIIEPELSIITSIGLDHMALLGNTRAAIAGEKAGIIKRNVPVVLGKMDPVLYEVFRQKTKEVSGDRTDVLLHFSEEEWEVTSLEGDDQLIISLQDKTADTIAGTYRLDLPGYYQQFNLPTVLSAVKVLRQKGFELTDEKIRYALQHVVLTTGLHGRWETIRNKPHIVLEVAHNEDGMRLVAAQLKRVSFNRLFIIIGMVKDKDIDSVITLLPAEATYFFCRASIPRALPAEELMEKAIRLGLQGTAVPDVNDAIAAASSMASSNDLILVCGSIFLVGEVDIDRWSKA
ncbi:MAG: bifunctional folylpolyglutamate synthase/dihydrofolate synthase [Bacteroidota bacterium]